VTVIEDQLDLPGCQQVAIYGTVSGFRPGWRIDVAVHTNDWYDQEPAVVQGGLWGARVYLSGKGQFNDHTIRVRLLGPSGREIASERVEHIRRVDARQRLKP